MINIGTAAAAPLQNDQYTKILMHFDNGHSNTSFKDETGRIWTRSGNAIQSNTSIYDGSVSALYTTRAASPYIYTTNVTDLCPGTQDFTLEFLAKRDTIGTDQRVFGNINADLTARNTTLDARFVGTSNKLRVSVGNGSDYKFLESRSAIDTNWHKYVIERKGRYLTILIDNKYQGSVDIGPSFNLLNSSVQFSIANSGAVGYPSMDGYIDELRYSVGIARVENNWMDWYALGDSNTDATNVGLTPNDGSWCYIFSTAQNDANLTADHAIGGYGMLSQWGVDNVANYYPYPKNYLIMLGSNDAHSGVSAATAASNVKQIYNYTTAQGSKTIICVPPMASDVGGFYVLAYQQQWLKDFEKNLTGYYFIKAYDPTDSNPTNGEPDAINASMFESDGRHLNEAGQTALGNYIYNQLQGNFTISSTTGTAPLTIKTVYSNSVISPIVLSVDFENDGTIDSNNLTSIHVFGKPGTYSIKTIAQNDYGNFSKLNNVTVSDQPAIDTMSKLYWWIRGYLGWV